jgi:hypothetical protein
MVDRIGYKNDPSIFSELVKFLADNTGFEAIDVLAKKVASMESTLMDLEKEANMASKAELHQQPTRLMKPRNLSTCFLSGFLSWSGEGLCSRRLLWMTIFRRCPYCY